MRDDQCHSGAVAHSSGQGGGEVGELLIQGDAHLAALLDGVTPSARILGAEGYCGIAAEAYTHIGKPKIGEAGTA